MHTIWILDFGHWLDLFSNVEMLKTKSKLIVKVLMNLYVLYIAILFSRLKPEYLFCFYTFIVVNNFKRLHCFILRWRQERPGHPWESL